MAGEDLASLGIKVDASQADAAAVSLDKLTAAGERADKQTGQLVISAKQLSDALAKNGNDLDKAIASLSKVETSAKATATATAQLNSAIATGSASFATLQQNIAASVGLTDIALKSASASAAVFGQSLKGLSALQASVAETTAETATATAALTGTQVEATAANQAAGVSALQLRESLVLLREASVGNFTRMAGSASILAGTFGAVTLAGVAMVGVIAAIVGSFVALEIGTSKLAEANRQLENEIAGVGTTTGVTLQQVETATRQGAEAADVSIATAKEWATVYATGGKAIGEVLTGLTSITQQFADATGQKATDAVKELAAAFADPAKGAQDLNEKLGFLNASQIQLIQNLQATGNLLGAQQVLYAALNKTLDDSANIHVHGLALAWKDVWDFASNAWDAMKVAAGGGTLLQQLAAAQEKLKGLQSYVSIDPAHIQAVKDAQAAVDTLTAAVNKYNQANAARNTQSLANQASTSVQPLVDSALPDASKVRSLTNDIGALRDAMAKEQAAGLATTDMFAKQQSALDVYQDTLGRVTAAYAQYGGQAGVNNAIADLEVQKSAAKTNAEKGEIESKIRLLQTIGVLQTNTDNYNLAQDKGLTIADKVNKSDDNKIASATKTLDAARLQLSLETSLNAQVEAGTITSAAAAQQLASTANARRIEAIAAGTQGDTYKKLMEIAKQLEQVDAASTAAKDTAALDKQNESLANQIALLTKETDTIKENNLQRAIELAQLKAEQDLQSGKFGAYNASDPTPEQLKYIQNQKDIAAGQVVLKNKTDSYNESLKFQSQLMDELATHAQNMASGLSDALGHVGTAIEGLTKAFTDNAAAQAKFAEQQAAIDKEAAAGKDVTQEQILLTQKQHDADIEYYADVAGAAKNFFEQGSAGYKLLQAVETAYRVYELEASIAAIVQKEAETGVVLSANAAQTASSATTAVANAAADVPFPFNLGAIATIVAVMAGFGILAGGGGSATAAAPPVDPAKALQAQNGSGTVLGDSTAKSDSIAKSIDQLTKDSNTDLEYSSDMVTSLRSIDNKIGDLTAKLAQQLQVGGALDATNAALGLGSSTSNNVPGLSSIPIVGGILNSLFGSSSSSTTLLDQGLNIIGTTVGQAIQNGISASTYQTTQTQTHSSALFGLISSSSTSTKTTGGPLGDDFDNNVQAIIAGLRNTVLDAATKLGVQGAQDVIDSFSVNIGQISLKGLTGDQIQTALNSVFSKLGDQITAAAIPQITALQQVGEGSLETLSRLVNEYEAVDDAAKTVGFTFSQVGVDSLAARDNLINLSGGLDNFTKQASFFVDNFLTTADSIAPIAKAVSDEMANLGLAGVTTKQQFIQVIQSLDTSTDAGAALYVALQNVAPAFAKVADAAQELADNQRDLQITLLQDEGRALDATNLSRQKELEGLDASLQPLQALIYATEDYNTAQSNLANAQKTVINQFQGYVTSLAAFGQSLSSSSSTNNILNQYAAARATFATTAKAAAAGDPTALANLQQVSSDFLNASKTGASSALQAARDLASVKDAVTKAQNAAQHQVDINTQQLTAINAVNDSVQSVTDALDNLYQMQAAYNVAQLKLASAQSLYSGQQSATDIAAQFAAYYVSNIPSHAAGLNFVPYDGYVAKLHKGERVQTQAEAANSNDKDMLAEIRAMRTQLNANTKLTNNLLRKFTNDGSSLNVKVVS